MKAFDLVVLVLTFLFNSLLLGVDWQYVAIATLGSFSGAVMLTYLRRDPRKSELVFKTLAASIGGLISGAAIEEYLKFQSIKYVIGIYFLCGLLSLVVLRALLNLTERNSASVLRGLLDRVFDLPSASDRRRYSKERDADNDKKEKGR